MVVCLCVKIKQGNERSKENPRQIKRSLNQFGLVVCVTFGSSKESEGHRQVRMAKKDQSR